MRSKLCFCIGGKVDKSGSETSYHSKGRSLYRRVLVQAIVDKEQSTCPAKQRTHLFCFISQCGAFMVAFPVDIFKVFLEQCNL